MFWDQVAWIYDLFADGLNRKGKPRAVRRSGAGNFFFRRGSRVRLRHGLLTRPLPRGAVHLLRRIFPHRCSGGRRKSAAGSKNISFEQADILHLRFPG